MAFGDGGELKDRLNVAGDAPTDADGASRTGTTVRFWPDGSIFDETDYRFQTLQERFQMMAFLNRGLEIRVRDQRLMRPSRPTIPMGGSASSTTAGSWISSPM